MLVSFFMIQTEILCEWHNLQELGQNEQLNIICK